MAPFGSHGSKAVTLMKLLNRRGEWNVVCDVFLVDNRVIGVEADSIMITNLFLIKFASRVSKQKFDLSATTAFAV